MENTKPSFDILLNAMGKQSATYDIDKIKRAYELGEQAHAGQMRLSGEDYFWHPLRVAEIVVLLGMDSESVVASLLHDAVEDTPMTTDDVRREFGETVALLVDGVTKLGRVDTVSREQEQAENVRKMLIAMAQDIRVIIIKLADRLHNMRTMAAQSEPKQLKKSLETLEIYAPIAHRLGIRAVKEELEDLAIHFLDPVAYSEIESRLEENKEYRLAFIEDIKRQIRERLDGTIPNLSVEGRVKSVHGIYRKMYMQGKQFEEIYDIYAVRVIVDSVIDCYNVLGTIHEMFHPIPGRFKDYISTPKPNMYQSLHTTVIGGKGMAFEVQIRTWQMHHTAEYGIAAHWKYKSGVNTNDEKFEERLAWVRQLLESQDDADDVGEIVRTIKTDLSSDEVFGVTPKGDIISLPKGSTIIDYAYAIHSAVGNRMIGAKVDGRIMPRDYKIKNGGVSEIITTYQADRGPSRDWLKIVKTSSARAKIRGWFKKERRPENIETGRTEFDRALRQANMRLSDREYSELIAELAERYQCPSGDDFYAKIGYGGVALSNIMPAIKERYKQRSAQESMRAEAIENIIRTDAEPTASPDGVIVEGIDNCLVKLSRCCSPLPGDPIIGFITRGHGVSVHKRDCTNVPREIETSAEPGRWIPARWAVSHSSSFAATLQILAFDRDGLLFDISSAVMNMRIKMTAISARQLRDGNCAIDITLHVESVEHLKSVISKLAAVSSVFSVERQVV